MREVLLEGGFSYFFLSFFFTMARVCEGLSAWAAFDYDSTMGGNIL